MYIVTLICTNPFTGRKAWACREVPSGEYGDKWLSSFVVIKSRWFSLDARIDLADKIRTTSQRRQMQIAVRSLGFTSAYGIRDGRIKRYKLG